MNEPKINILDEIKGEEYFLFQKLFATRVAKRLNVNGWSIVPTADGKGLSLKPDDASANQYEICVALRPMRGGVLHLSIHEDGVDAPVFEIDQTLTEGE